MTFTADAFKEMGAATALDLVPDAVGGFPVVRQADQAGLGARPHEGRDADALPEALLAALGYGDTAIVEKWIDGCELAVSVLDGAGRRPRCCRRSRWSRSPASSTSRRCTRAARPTTTSRRAWTPRSIAEVRRGSPAQVHTLLGCRDVSRVDMVVGADGTPYVLECNTSPGMTETSLLPDGRRGRGHDFQEVVERLVRAALDRNRVARRRLGTYAMRAVPTSTRSDRPRRRRCSSMYDYRRGGGVLGAFLLGGHRRRRSRTAVRAAFRQGDPRDARRGPRSTGARARSSTRPASTKVDRGLRDQGREVATEKTEELREQDRRGTRSAQGAGRLCSRTPRGEGRRGRPVAKDACSKAADAVKSGVETPEKKAQGTLDKVADKGQEGRRWPIASSRWSRPLHA